MKIRRIHRLTIAVHDIDGARLTFEQLLDARGGESRVVREFMVRALDIPLADSQLQLVSPLATDNPLKSYLQRKGEGFYTLALEVESLDDAIAELRELGIKVSEPVETETEPGVRSAFVTAAATHGLSLQLVEVTRAEGEPAVGPVTLVQEPRAEHLAMDEPAAEEAEQDSALHPAAASTAEWADREDASAAAPLDLTPDEWSDAD